MSRNRDRYNKTKDERVEGGTAKENRHETSYEVRKREQAKKEALRAEKKEARKDDLKKFANSVSSVTNKVNTTKNTGTQDTEKDHHVSHQKNLSHGGTEPKKKISKLQGVVGKRIKATPLTPRIIGMVACVLLVIGIAIAFGAFGGSKVQADTVNPNSIMPSVTNVYSSGLSAMGKEAQEGDAQQAKEPMIPLKPKEYDPIVYSYPAAGKMVAITFDDGPNKDTTEKYLKILADNGVKASFFMLGKSVQAYPDLAKKVESEGHDVLSHFYQHAILPKLDEASLQNDFEQVNTIFKSVLGHTPKFMRPPYGNYNDTTLATSRKYGQIPIYWSIDTNDWRGRSTENMVETITSHLSDGAIILMHEGKSNTLEALPAIIKAIKDAGYTIVPLSEMLSY